jgi:hypothetical protein
MWRPVVAALQLLFLGAAVDARVPIVRQLPVVDGGGGPLSALKLPLEIAEPLDRHVRSEELSGAQHGEMLRALTHEIGKVPVEEPKSSREPTHHGTAARQLQETVVEVSRQRKEGWVAYLQNGSVELADPEGGVSGGGCTDPLAVDNQPPGHAAPDCTYDCEQLNQHYFGDDSTRTTRCFIYERASPAGSWPIEGNWPQALMDMKSTILDWWPLAPDSLWADPPDGTNPVTFVVGAGRQCRNVTFVTRSEEEAIETAFGGLTPADLNTTFTSETMCIYDGLHHPSTAGAHTHFAADHHELFQEWTGELGECTDVVIRVRTDTNAELTGPVTWSLMDHESTWTHSCSLDGPAGTSCTGDHEYFMCLYDNDFTLERTSFADDGWSGTVEVHTFVPDNTIRIPVNEAWIIQGYSVDGVPVELDARLASGDPWGLTRASIVLRHVRLCAQAGTLDSHMTGGPRDSTRGFSQRPFARMGGAFYYEGGFGSIITMDHVLMDHNGAISGSGGAIMIAGRGELNTPYHCNNGWLQAEIDERIAASRLDGATEESAYPPVAGLPGCGLTISITGSTFWGNSGFVSGVLRSINTHPITLNLDNNIWVDNDAIVAPDWGFWYYPSIGKAAGHFGASEYNVFNEKHLATSNPKRCMDEETKNPYGGLWCEAGLGAGINLYSFESPNLDLTSQPPSWSLQVYNVEQAGKHQWYHPQGVVSPQDYNGNVAYNYTGFNVHDNVGLWTTTKWQSGILMLSNLQRNMVTILFSHNTWADNFVLAESEASSIAEAAHIFVQTTGTQTVEYSTFSGGRARSGTAITFKGDRAGELAGSLIVYQCVFQNNIAFADGGAIRLEAANLVIQSSIFNTNQVVVPSGVNPTRGVVVRLFTGSMGYADGIENVRDLDQEIYLPVFKIDGEPPYTVCEGVHADFVPPRDANGVPCDMHACETRCKDGDVPANESVYGSNRHADTPYYRPQKSYAETFELTRGTHTLWIGTMVQTHLLFYGWSGGAWIDLVGPGGFIVHKVYPAMTDYRALPDGANSNQVDTENYVGYTDYAISPACWSATAASLDPEEDADVVLCPHNVTFWRKIEFDVPFGDGGAVASAGRGATISITDTTFADNSADVGGAIHVVGADSLLIKDSQQGPRDTVESTVPPAECGPGMCDLGQQCTTSGAGASGFICSEPCAINAFGNGYNCEECGPGTQPGCAGEACEVSGPPTGCIPCGPGEISQIGFCTPCPPLKFPNDAKTECLACAAGLILSTDGSECQACPPGTSSSADGVGCDRCSVRGDNYYSTGEGGECQTCGHGKQARDDRTGCEECPPGTHSVGGESICMACPAGSEPADAITCIACAAGKYSQDGRNCEACPPGAQPNGMKTRCELCTISDTFSDTGEACIPCPARQTPNADRTACFCQTGTYEIQTWGKITCDGLGEEGARGDQCVECPHCLVCEDRNTKLAAGFAFFGDGDAYECPGNDDDGETVGCPGGPLANISTSLSTCSQGYSGPICGSCSDDFSHLKVGKPCVSCADGKVNVLMILGLFIVLLLGGAIVVSGAIKVLQDHGIVTDARLIIGFYQIIAQISNVIDIDLPQPVPQLSALMKLLFLDLRSIIRLDCWHIGGFHGKLVTNLLVIPLVYVAGCVFVYSGQYRTVGQLIGAGAADESAYVTAKVKFQRHLFLGVFLLYPTITTTLFRVPQCRIIGETEYHEEDYSIECVGSFWTLVFMSVGGICLVPVGVPLVLWIKMKAATDSLGGAQVSALGGAKLSADNVKDEDDHFGFLTFHVKPEFW